MAKNDELDAGKAKKSSKSIWMIVAATLVLISITGGASYVLGIVPFHQDNSSGNDEPAGAYRREQVETVIYHALDPAFVVNFKPNLEARLMQLSLSVTASDQKVIDTIDRHTPMIRNNLLLLMAGQDPAVLKTVEGKETLRARILEEIQKVVETQGKQKGVKEVFFTGFVMQ